MSGILAAQSTVCCCKPLPYAPCDYFEAREWYTQNPDAFPSVQVSVEVNHLITRIHVPVPDTSCGECYGKQSSLAWTVASQTLQRVPFTPGGGIFPPFARWESQWTDTGSFSQQPGQCDVTLECCASCCQPGGSNYDPTCIPNYQQPAWFCECCGGLCGCNQPWTKPQQNTYYYGCGQENYDLPSPCASCSSRTRETGSRTAAPLTVQPQVRIVLFLGGFTGGCGNPLPNCPPPFVSGTSWQMEVEARVVIQCESGTTAGIEGTIATYKRICCNYLAGPAGTYYYCNTIANPPSGSFTSLQGCDQSTRTWTYAETAMVT